MSTLRSFLGKIPELIGAVYPEQLVFYLESAFDRELEGRTSFRGEPIERLFLLTIWPCSKAEERDVVVKALEVRMLNHGIEEHGRGEWRTRWELTVDYVRLMASSDLQAALDLPAFLAESEWA